jgi:hypothetical protein
VVHPAPDTDAHAPSRDGVAPERGRASTRPESLLIGLFGAVASQVALLTALLYYVGWARSHATLGYFGIDPALVGYSTVDYVLRSLTATFVPVIVGTLVGLGAFVLHHQVVRPRVRRGGRPVRRLLVAGLAVAGLLAVLVCARLVAPDLVTVPFGLGVPVCLLVAVGSIAYFDHLWALSAADAPRSDATARLRLPALLGLALVSVLWSLAVYAQSVGEERAERIVAGLAADPAITVYSEKPLAIRGLGVRAAAIGVEGDHYRHVYTGLRLLVAGNGKIVLLPVGWRYGENAIVLPDDDSLRIDVAARHVRR